MTSRRRPMTRIGDLLPDAARGLGLEDELRLSRAMATFERLVAERVPAASGACRVVRIEGFAVVVEADAPIVAQELRLRAPELRCVIATSEAVCGLAADRAGQLAVFRDGARAAVHSATMRSALAASLWSRVRAW